MINAARRRSLLVVSSLAIVVSNQALASGYEKATMWDAKYSALAGAATSSVGNSSAIFFNPAGLAFADSNDFSLHVSPTFSRIDSPANGSDTFTEGEDMFAMNGGFTGLYQLNEKFTLGYGIYGAGGSMSEYGDITTGMGSFAQTGDLSTTIKIIEAGLALAYRINKNWSVGGTYRLTYAMADINMASATGPGDAVGVNVQYEEMDDWNTFGVRLGAMFRSDNDRWGWGIDYRSEVEAEAEGEAALDVGGQNQYRGRDITAKTTLPFQISTGVDYQITDDVTLFGEVTYSNYSTNKSITFSSDDTNLPVNEVNQEWDDQYNYRVAVEYTGLEDWALRGGYIYTTSIVPEEYASPTFSTPSFAHTITFGAGRSFMNGKVDLDLAGEYNIVENDDVKGGAIVTDSGAVAPSGRYESKAYAVHMSLRYYY
ncbi:outer membrane protein transport protein [Parendozoicomonas sp. Alg238-R29]|uniref:OmpP1/FadL family transporter n=1 Tax=Parendozoicomonas sp. Alg238-R29 TaxID=2993446 RepID=UPI00248DD598|nr:outer membrane protein transport protein [Parendozoicomonas sp. Alg238-R29]